MKRLFTITLVLGALGAIGITELNAQAGCTSTKEVYVGGNFYCTTDAGSTCVTCHPKPQ